MAQGRFFYSTNGTDIVGPVTEDQLRQLWQDNQLGTGSFVCRAGETRWTPLARDTSRAPVVARVRSTKIVPSEVFAKAARACAPSAPPDKAAPSAPPTAPALSPTAQPEPDAGDPGDNEFIAVVVNTIAGMFAVGGALLSTLLAQPPQVDSDTVLSYRLGWFAGSLGLIVLIPWLLALMAKGKTRILVRGILIAGLAVLSVAFNLSRSEFSPLAQAQAIGEQQKREAQKQIARKGYFTSDNQQAEQNIQKLQGQLTGDTEASRMGRDILTVTSGLLAKVKASDDIEGDCKFTLDGVKSADDLTAQITGISKLRAAQVDVVAFLQGYDGHCRDALAADHIAPAQQDAVIAGAHKGAHVDQLISLWQEKIKLSDDHIARFDFLRKGWGGWQFTYGQVSFADDAQATAYDQLVEAIQADVDKIRDTQKQIFQ